MRVRERGMQLLVFRKVAFAFACIPKRKKGERGAAYVLPTLLIPLCCLPLLAHPQGRRKGMVRRSNNSH